MFELLSPVARHAGTEKEWLTNRLSCVIPRVHLYRIMTEVRAGKGQEGSTPGQRGLATIWVQCQSEEDARMQAQQIVEGRQYKSFGELTVYLEHTHGSASAGAGAEDTLAAGYSSMKQKALASGDGLFEIWFPSK